MNAVIRTEGGATSLLVDEIGDVVDVDDEDFEPVPDTLSREGRQLLKGVYKLDSRLLMHLDAEKTIDISEHMGTRTTKLN